MRVRVLTYNIHRAIGLDRRFRPERIASILERHAADIVLLQEVDEGVPRSSERDLARDLAEALGYPHRAVGHNVTLRKGRYGNATLSRHRILSERNIDLSIGLWRRRGCQHTAIALEGRSARRRLDVFNLHLGLSARERERQVALLSRSHELAGLAPDVPCLVAGDFNDWRQRINSSLTGAQLHAWDGKAAPTFPSRLPLAQLDHVFARGLQPVGVAVPRGRDWWRMSDHLPLIADFQLRS